MMTASTWRVVARAMADNYTDLDYVSFISSLNEANRPPGGKHTVRYWAINAYVGPRKRVLEIGSNTGFTSLELTRATGCRVVGVDISTSAVEAANRILLLDTPDVQSRVEFRVGDATKLPFEDKSFDVVVCGGALSFISARHDALREVERVLRPWGFVCIAPLFYHSPPPEELVREVEALLGLNLPRLSAAEWERLMTRGGLERYCASILELRKRPVARVAAYVDRLIAESAWRGHVDEASVRQRAMAAFDAFNRNHEYLSALVGVFRKRHLPEEPELFGVVDVGSVPAELDDA